MTMMHDFVCCTCGRHILAYSIVRAYDAQDRPLCQDCAACNACHDLREKGKGYCYLNTPEKERRCDASAYTVTDFLGLVSFRVLNVKQGRHNIAGSRYDVWFVMPYDKYIWHGVQYGENTQLLHVRRTKNLR